MDTKLAARIGAVAFVAIAITMAALELRDPPKPPTDDPVVMIEPDGDALAATLKTCAAMGTEAAADPGCRDAWGQQRRRFLGRDIASVATNTTAGAE